MFSYFFLCTARASSQKREANKNSFVNTPTFYLYTYRSTSLSFELMKDALMQGIIMLSAYTFKLFLNIKI